MRTKNLQNAGRRDKENLEWFARSQPTSGWQLLPVHCNSCFVIVTSDADVFTSICP